VTPHRYAAICLWILAWFFAGLIPAAWFAARDGRGHLARTELAAGLLGTAGFALTGAALW
jgi:hypothetical protein